MTSTASRSNAIPIQSRGAAASTYHPAAISQGHQHSASPAPHANPSSYTHTPTNHSLSHLSNVSLPNQHPSRYDQHSTPQPPLRQSYGAAGLSTSNIGGSKANDIWMLSEHANAAIPPEIREEFQCDEKGHVLFFTTPPVDTTQPPKSGAPIGHTAKYLANKLRQKIAIREKRKAAGLPEEGEDPDSLPVSKKVKTSTLKVETSEEFHQEVITLRQKALDVWIKQMDTGTETIYKAAYGEEWKAANEHQKERLAKTQADSRNKAARIRASEAKRQERQKVSWGGSIHLDDWGTMF